MDSGNIIFNEQNFTNGGDIYATKVRPAAEYVNKQKTGKVIGLNVTVVFPRNHYDTLNVIVADPVDRISALLEKDDGPVRVSFTNFRARAYVMNGKLGFSARADSVTVLTDDVVDDMNFDNDFDVPELNT